MIDADYDIHYQHDDTHWRITPFDQYAARDGSLQRLEQETGIIRGALSHFRGSGSFTQLQAQIHGHLLRQNNLEMQKIDDLISTDPEAQFLTNMLGLQAQTVGRVSFYGLDSQAAAAALEQTVQVAIPQMRFYPTDGGRFEAEMLGGEAAPHHLGVLLGADVLRHAPLMFGSYTDELLGNQIDLTRTLAESQPIYEKVLAGERISAQEMGILENLQTLADQSQVGLAKLAQTTITQKAYGEYPMQKGAIGIGLDSALLMAGEVVLGSRYEGGDDYYRALQFEMRGAFGEYASVSQFAEGSPGASVENLLGLVAPSLQAGDADVLRQQVAEIQGLRGALQASVDSTQAQELRGSMESDIQQRQLNVENLVYSRVLNRTEAEVAELRARGELASAFGLGMGQIHRSGGPPASSGAINANNLFTGLTTGEYNRRMEELGLSLTLSEEYNNTLMLLPTVGRTLGYLGDFDGDTYQFKRRQYNENLSRINEINKQLDRLNRPMGQTRIRCYAPQDRNSHS